MNKLAPKVVYCLVNDLLVKRFLYEEIDNFFAQGFSARGRIMLFPK
jgi:hypothetical protein